MCQFYTQEAPKDLRTPAYLEPGYDRRTLQVNIERSVEYRMESDIDLFGESGKT